MMDAWMVETPRKVERKKSAGEGGSCEKGKTKVKWARRGESKGSNSRGYGKVRERGKN